MDFKYFNFDTILAPATPLQAGGALGIIRISGVDAFSVASRVLRTRIENPLSHRLYRADFYSREGVLLDLGLFVQMAAPNSFTGEDVVELHLHGNPLILHEVLAALLAGGGVRMAEPGEFSFRAFRNGRLDLAQAESIGSLVAAKSLQSIRAAALALEGSTTSLVVGLRDRLVNVLAQVELDIDFADQGVPQLDFSRLESVLVELSEDLLQLHRKFLLSRPLREGIQLAIVGAPNSGKSTLFNQILRMDRSIVSDIAGTTRDVVKESIYYSGLLFVLADTAGLRETADEIERRGIERSYLTVEAADAALIVIDSLDPVASSLAHVENLVSGVRARSEEIQINLCWNKVDSGSTKEMREIADGLGGASIFPISALTGFGVDILMDSIAKGFLARVSGDDGAGIWHIRHGLALEECAGLLRLAVENLRLGLREQDLIAVHLRSALDRLGEITGEFSSDDLLNHIFSKFCIGK